MQKQIFEVGTLQRERPKQATSIVPETGFETVNKEVRTFWGSK